MNNWRIYIYSAGWLLGTYATHTHTRYLFAASTGAPPSLEDGGCEAEDIGGLPRRGGEAGTTGLWPR